MPHFVYIDESGTMDHQGVMSVAAVVFEGAHSAQNLHDQVMKALDPQYYQLVKRLKKERKPANEMPHLHFTELNDDQKRTVASRLAKAKLSIFTASYFHEPTPKNHDARFAIYTEVVKMTIRDTLEDHKELVIAIGKQGGWQKYERDFRAQLRPLVEELTRSGNYRKADFILLPATKPGIQIADFYVGTIRDLHKSDADSLPVACDLLRQQFVTKRIYTLALTSKKER